MSDGKKPYWREISDNGPWIRCSEYDYYTGHVEHVGTEFLALGVGDYNRRSFDNLESAKQHVLKRLEEQPTDEQLLASHNKHLSRQNTELREIATRVAKLENRDFLRVRDKNLAWVDIAHGWMSLAPWVVFVIFAFLFWDKLPEMITHGLGSPLWPLLVAPLVFKRLQKKNA